MISKSILPIVVIVGRTNVGKSTLFNSLANKKIAITKNEKNTTRNCLNSNISWLGKEFILVDSGGFEFDLKNIILKKVYEQNIINLNSADLILFLVDGQEGINNLDKDISIFLRKIKKKIILVINKIENYQRDKDNIYEFYKLGLKDIFLVSAEQKTGIGDLLDLVIKYIYSDNDDKNLNKRTDHKEDIEVLNSNNSDNEEKKIDKKIIKIAVVGKPNVGKSSFVNKILGEERNIVDSMSGTTRDSVDSFCNYNNQDYMLIDTAGIRKKNKIKESLEFYSVLRSKNAIKQCDVCILIIDTENEINEQDAKIAGIVSKNFKPLIVAINKWDLVEKNDYIYAIDKFNTMIDNILGFARKYTQKIFLSALTGEGILKIFDFIKKTWHQYNFRIKTHDVNYLIKKSITKNPPGFSKYSKRLKIYYSLQVDVCPPTFVLFVNDPVLMHFSYKRYLENQLIKEFNFSKTPIKIITKKK
ncbi:MAG: ribosome biogenesis GTPase Der [Clostridiales bacterium]|nr:ribosome biogenesis GTPase Der [Clostridiales bacterium]